MSRPDVDGRGKRPGNGPRAEDYYLADPAGGADDTFLSTSWFATMCFR